MSDERRSGGVVRVAGLAAAEREVRRRVERVLGGVGPDGRRPVLVGVTGPVGSGKSTLAARLAAGGVAGVHLTTDRYLPDYDEVEPGTEDEPWASDLQRLAADLGGLAAGRRVSVPVWSFHTHRREGDEQVGPAEAGGVVAVEGLHALNDRVLPRLDDAVLVDAPREVRLERWVRLARRGERGWNEAETRAFFEGVAEPTFERFRAAYAAAAGIIVWNDEERGGPVSPLYSPSSG